MAIRDYTATGVKHPMFTGSFSSDGGMVISPGFGAGAGYWFNLAFRDELTNVLVQDAQDELDMLMLYPDQEVDTTPGSCCTALGDGGSLFLIHRDTTWQPNRIIRTSHWHKCARVGRVCTSSETAHGGVVW